LIEPQSAKNKASREIKVLDIKLGDPMLSGFFFNDINKILPSNDAACPGDGSCREDGQVLIQMKLK